MSEGKKEKIEGSTAGAGSLPAGPAAAVPQRLDDGMLPWTVGAKQNKTEIGGFTTIFDRDGRAPVAYVAYSNRAEQIVRACNAHDELVDDLNAERARNVALIEALKDARAGLALAFAAADTPQHKALLAADAALAEPSST